MNIHLSIKAKILVCILAIYIATFIMICLPVYKMAVKDTNRFSNSFSRDLACTFTSRLNGYMEITRSLGQIYETYGSWPASKRSDPGLFLQNALQKNDDLMAVWSIWEPQAPNKPNVAEAYYKHNGQIYSGKNYLDTSKNGQFLNFYLTSGKEKQETIIEPYIYSYSGNKKDEIIQTSIIYPIIDHNKFLGAVACDINLGKLQELFHNTSIPKGASAFLVSNSGKNIICSNGNSQNSTLKKLNFANRINSKILNHTGKNEIYSFSGRNKENGEKMFYSFAPVNIENTDINWALGIVIPQKTVKTETFKAFNQTLLIGLAGLIILILFAWNISEYITKTLGKITLVLKKMSLGDIDFTPSPLKTHQNDILAEIGTSVYKLHEGLNNTTQFAKEIGKGNFKFRYELLSEKDALGTSLLEMRDNLLEAQKHEQERISEDQKRNWANNGIAKFSEILRQNNDKLKVLSFDLIENLVKYLKANQGGLFIINDNDPNDIFIEMTACLAYDRKKYHQKRIELGEGLIGRCVLEAETIYLTEIPEDYIEITSGLGGDNPRCLLLVPLKVDKKVFGVIEIASFIEMESYQVQFIEKLGENIASTLSNVKINTNTQILLAKFQQQTEEMTAQEEELRQNLEELQSTQEEMDRIKKEENEKTKSMMQAMEENRKLLFDIIDKIPGRIVLKDASGKLVILNSAFARVFNKKVDALIGKNNFDIYPQEIATKYFEKDREILEKGPQFYLQEEKNQDGTVHFMQTTRMPFYIANLKQNGILSIQVDVTEIKNMEIELSRKNEVLVKAQNELNKEKYLMDALMNNIPDSIYFKDELSRFILVSKAMMNKFNTENPNILIGKSDFDFFAKEHAQRAYDDEQNIIKTGKPLIDVIEKETWTDGSLSWVSTTKMPLLNEKNDTVGTFGISRDITKLMKMELLAEQEKKMVDLLSKNIPVIFYEVDPQGKFAEFRGAGLTRMSLTEKDMLGKNIYEIYPQSADPIHNSNGEDVCITFNSTGIRDNKKWQFKHYLFNNKVVNGGFIGFAYEMED